MASGLEQRMGQLPTEQLTRRLHVNVGERERWLSLLAGGILTAYGLSRRSLAGLGLALVGGSLIYRGGTGHCSMYQALGMNTAEPQGGRASIAAGEGIKIEESIAIDRPAEELYRFWRQLENLPQIMQHLQEVRATGPNRYHWVARGPLGLRFEWDAEIITETPNELIGWRSLPGSTVDTAGSVHFHPRGDGRSTEVRVSLKYLAPAGKLGSALAGLLGRAPEQQVREDLQRFKQHVESQQPAGF